MLRPIAARLPAQSHLQPRPEPADTARVERSRRVYFLLLGIAAVFGWSVGLWAAPIVAFVTLEAVWTAAEWTRARGGAMRAARSPRRRYVR
jgi:hypothetical protein